MVTSATPEQRRGEPGLCIDTLMLPVGHRQHREEGSTPLGGSTERTSSKPRTPLT